MSTSSTESARTTYAAIARFQGLNQSKDGDTGLGWGEGAVMRNFIVTADGHLQIRPGTQPVLQMGDGPVRGIYRGMLRQEECVLAACAGHIWKIEEGAQGFTKTDLGEVDDVPVHFFPFQSSIYLLGGRDYLYWDGEGDFRAVEGYVPLVAVSSLPEGGGTLLESVNKLTGKKRQRFSPDGSARVFYLAESEIDALDTAERLDGIDLPQWTADLAAGTVTFQTAPDKGTDCLEIGWTKGSGDREAVTEMRYSEAYNGAADTRLFLYGDGTSLVLYTGLDENGQPRADYFPDLNVLHVDAENTAVTGMVRHFDKLMAFKGEGAFQISYDTLTMVDGSVTAAFYVMPVNRTIGNEAPGQVRLVGNWPRTLFGNGVYTWSTGESVRDDRLAKRISARAEQTLEGFDFARVTVFDDPVQQNYVILCGEKALIHHYGIDAWTYHEGPEVTCAVRLGSELYLGSAQGQLLHLSRAYRNDCGQEIDAYFETGSMDFTIGHLRKYLRYLFISMQPEAGARVHVTAMTNRGPATVQRVVAYSYITFWNVDFGHFSFRTNRRPQVKKERIRVRQFTYLKLILASRSRSATATVLGAELGFRYGGMIR